jgi:phage-related protein (TIGR01555 family)
MTATSTSVKPRIRVRAPTTDAYQNFSANFGYGSQNLTSAGTYGFNPISRFHVLLEWMYRGSWISKKVVDCVADDMTRAGTLVDSDMTPDRIDALHDLWDELRLWNRLNATLKWSRLYGTAMAVIVIDGQRMDTPLRVETVGKGQFKGLVTFDRWQLFPSTNDLVTDPANQDFGLPRYYEVVADARSLPSWKIHHSRCIRFDGIELPFWQSMSENYFGSSVLEPAYDRILAFDSTTAGAAQLVFKAHLRVIKIDKLRDIIARNDGTIQAVYAQLEMIRTTQSSEGLTVLDAKDDFQANTIGFGGLSDVMIQFSQQLAGSADIPLTRLFGQSPAGLSSTGESDMRNYYDAINSQQKSRMLRPVRLLYDLLHRSRFGEPLPDGFGVTFAPLWQLSETERAGIASTVVQAISAALQDGAIDIPTAMKELRQSSRVTGIFSNITDEAIQAAREAPPPSPMGPDGQPLDPNDPTAQQTGASPAGPHTPGNNEGPQPTDAPATPGATEAEADDTASGATMPAGALTGASAEANPAEATEAPDGWVAPPPDGTWVEVLKDGKRWVHITKDGGTQDYPMRTIHGIDVVIETPKGTTRRGYGWASVMPADYGYCQGTSSEEGPREQMDIFVGPDEDSELAWVIDQLTPETGTFDESKAFLNFGSEKDVTDCYKSAFSDGRGAERIGTIRRMHVDVLRKWLAEEWPYGKGELKPDR